MRHCLDCPSAVLFGPCFEELNIPNLSEMLCLKLDLTALFIKMRFVLNWDCISPLFVNKVSILIQINLKSYID
jgi:hypothetical protein